MGILSHHVPVIEPLKPGMLEVIEGGGGEPKRWFGAQSLAWSPTAIH
jgi:F-type H+-transporting ATPase subunit delta